MMERFKKWVINSLVVSNLGTKAKETAKTNEYLAVLEQVRHNDTFKRYFNFWHSEKAAFWKFVESEPDFINYPLDAESQGGVLSDCGIEFQSEDVSFQFAKNYWILLNELALRQHDRNTEYVREVSDLNND